jgi:hypothetical protein
MSHAVSVEALFFAALEKKTAAERTAYPDSACGGARPQGGVPPEKNRSTPVNVRPAFPCKEIGRCSPGVNAPGGVTAETTEGGPPGKDCPENMVGPVSGSKPGWHQ